MSDDLSRYYGHSSDFVYGGHAPVIARGLTVRPHVEQNWRDNYDWRAHDREWTAEMIAGANDDGGL